MNTSYTSMKIVHDRKIQEALEQQRLHAEQKTRRPGLLQKSGKFLARFNKPVDKHIICDEQA